MSAVAKLKKVLAANVLLMDLVEVPAAGASDAEISAIQEALPRRLSKTHEDILRNWNGLNLDIIRIFRAGQSEQYLPGLLDHQDPPLA